MRRARAVIWLLWLSVPSAHADAVVNLCTADDQAGTGVNLASALAVGGRITFSCGGPATILVNCTHLLSSDTEIDGNSVITLRGPMRASSCSGGAAAMFDNSSALRLSLKLSKLRIIDAQPGGAPVGPSEGNVTRGSLDLSLADVTIANSYSPILVDQGQVRIDRSEFTGNDWIAVAAPNVTIADHTKFVGNTGSPLDVRGGNVKIADAVFASNKNSSNLSKCVSADISNSQFTGNAGRGVGGALIVNCNSRIANSSFINNQAKDGGAIYIGDLAGQTKMLGVDFTGNVASGGGGAIAMRFETFAPAPPAQLLELHHVTFKANHAQIAGALEFARGALSGVALNDRKLTGYAVQFIDNQADMFAGGLLVSRAQAHFSRSTFSGNRALQTGGAVVGLQASDGFIEFGDSLIVRNSAPTGAAFAGGGVVFINTTIADNDSPSVTGVSPASLLPLTSGAVGPQPIQFHNAIIAGAAGAICSPPIADAPYADLGHNLQYPGVSCGPSIAQGAPQFGPYYIPLPTSPAANGGDDAVCAAPPIAGRDIWDNLRPKGGAHCTIGAAEADPQQIVDQGVAPLVGAVSNLGLCICLKH